MQDDRKTESPINKDAALKYTAGDPELLISVAAMFLEEGPKQLQVVRSCIEAGDSAGTRKAAHALKGSVVIFGAERAAAAAEQVELAATDKDSSRVPKAWEVLSREMKRLLGELQQMCRQ